MNKQVTKKLSPVPVSTPTNPATEKPTTEKNKTSLGKREKSEPSEANSDGTDDLDSVIVSEPRKKIQKINHSTTIDGESAEKMESEIILEPTTEKNKTSPQKSEPSEGNSDGTDDLDSDIMSEPKKIQKVNHSTTIEKESAEKMKFVETKISCVCGEFHTITLSDDGTAYAFGGNENGQLGLGHNDDVSLPTPIPNLPQINLISCGWDFTVCVDHEGFIWSFGDNDYGQLGTGNKTNFNVPQKLLDIPPVVSVSCGSAHTLVITNDSNLWSWGRNGNGSLCHPDDEDRSMPQKTSFSNILKISTGCLHTLFRNDKGEIFACGYNEHGQCGLGHFHDYQITPSLIPNVPSNIVHFVCGYNQNLFLDAEGYVFSVGFNGHGELGLGHNTDQSELNKIPNIPPIKIISCSGSSCYLIDFGGNLWSFGYNANGQLGHGDEENINTPKVINTLKDMQQISYGSSADYFLAKNSQNQIFVTGSNNIEELVTGDTESVSIPKEIDPQYSTIWRDEIPNSRAKSARK